MRNLVALILFFSCSFSLIAQEPNPEKPDLKTSYEEENSTNEADEKEEFERAINQTKAQYRIASLLKFIEDFPTSERKNRALENIVSARAEIADEKLRLSEIDKGIRLFKLAVKESPTPVSDKLFSSILIKFPANLLFRQQIKAAFELAKMIEEKVGENPKHLLALATFYLSTENGAEAERLAKKSLEIDPQSARSYYTLGFANRLNFNLEESAEAFANSLELDPESINTKISLAEMKRALGLPYEAIYLYREVLEKENDNIKAKTGLALSLFDIGRKDKAERKMTEVLDENPKNVSLLVGAAYWYAVHKDGMRAVELAKRVITFEPRYTWTYIAMARGFMAQGDPLAAENALLAARQYGNFPTLAYELACARLAAGFNREAVEGLKESFELEGNLIKTRLGGRIEKKSANFIDLLSLERRASIFQVNFADDPLVSTRLKTLLSFMKKMESEEDDTEIALDADKFIDGEDKMKIHRQLFVANQLLEKKKALSKVLKITQNAVFGVRSAVEVDSPSSAVMAEELYESRRLSLARGQTVIVPNIPKQTLLNIVRGRIEYITASALLQQEKKDEAKLHLRRAISVLPKKSIWWRSSLWKFGTILESEGRSEEALDAFIKSYYKYERETQKKAVIETLYAKVHGNSEGLEEKLRRKPSESNKTSIFMKKSNEVEKEKSVKEISSKSNSKKLLGGVSAVNYDTSSNSNDKINGNFDSNYNEIESGKYKIEAKTRKDENEKAKVLMFEGLEEEKLTKKSDVENTEENSAADNLTRPRIVVEKNKPQKCRTIVSLEYLSIKNEGGSMAVTVSLEGSGNEKSTYIKAVSNNPEDVEVVFEKESDVVRGGFVFLIKSLNSNKGVYEIEFETLCGKKKISVEVS